MTSNDHLSNIKFQCLPFSIPSIDLRVHSVCPVSILLLLLLLLFFLNIFILLNKWLNRLLCNLIYSHFHFIFLPLYQHTLGKHCISRLEIVWMDNHNLIPTPIVFSGCMCMWRCWADVLSNAITAPVIG